MSSLHARLKGILPKGGNYNFSNTKGQLTRSQCMSLIPTNLKWIGLIQSEKKWNQFFRCSRAANSVVHGRIWLNFKLIQALMHVLIACKYEKDQMKNSGENVMTPFSPL